MTLTCDISICHPRKQYTEPVDIITKKCREAINDKIEEFVKRLCFYPPLEALKDGKIKIEELVFLEDNPFEHYIVINHQIAFSYVIGFNGIAFHYPEKEGRWTKYAKLLKRKRR